WKAGFVTGRKDVFDREIQRLSAQQQRKKWQSHQYGQSEDETRPRFHLDHPRGEASRHIVVRPRCRRIGERHVVTKVSHGDRVSWLTVRQKVPLIYLQLS